MNTLRAVLLAVVVLVASGCNTTLRTDVALRPDATTELSVTATFDGPVAAAIDDAALADLVATFVERTGTEPDVDRSEDSLVVSGELTYDQLVDAADIVGVASLAVHDRGDGTATVTVTEAVPTKLIDTIRQAAADEADPEAVAATMLSRTQVVVAVSFGDGEVTTDGAGVVDGNIASHARNLDEPGATSWTATGPWPEPSSASTLAVAASVAVIAGALGGAAWRLWGPHR